MPEVAGGCLFVLHTRYSEMPLTLKCTSVKPQYDMWAVKMYLKIFIFYWFQLISKSLNSTDPSPPSCTLCVSVMWLKVECVIEIVGYQQVWWIIWHNPTTHSSNITWPQEVKSHLIWCLEGKQSIENLFHQIGPLGRSGLVVAVSMEIFIYMSPFHVNFLIDCIDTN